MIAKATAIARDEPSSGVPVRRSARDPMMPIVNAASTPITMRTTYQRGADGFTSVQQVRQALARVEHARVLGTGDLEVLEQPRAHRVLAVGVERREEVEQPGERVVEVSAADVEVGDRELRVDIGGLVGGGRRTSSATAPSRRCSSSTCARPATASASRGFSAIALRYSVTAVAKSPAAIASYASW